MNKDTKLKVQIFGSIGFATLIIIGSAIFFFQRLSHLLETNESIIAHTEEQIAYCNELEPLVYKIIQHKTHPNATQFSAPSVAYKSALTEIDQTLARLKHIATQEQDNSPIVASSYERIQAAVKNITSIDEKEIRADLESASSLADEQFQLRTAVHHFIDALLTSREEQVTQNESSIHSVKDITIGLVAVALLIFIYTFYKIYQAS